MPSRDLTFSPTPPPRPQHHVSQGTLLHIPAVDRPSFLLLIHSDCTMLPQRRLDHSQTQRQSSSPETIATHYFILTLLHMSALRSCLSPSTTLTVCIDSSSSALATPLALKIGLQVLPIVSAQDYKPNNTTLSLTYVFQRLRRSSHTLKVPPRSSQTYRFHQIDKRGSFVPRPCRRSHPS